MQEARGEEGEEAVAPLGRIQLQERQVIPATAAAGSSSGGFGPRVVIRDGKTVVDEDSLTFHAQVQPLRGNPHHYLSRQQHGPVSLSTDGLCILQKSAQGRAF